MEEGIEEEDVSGLNGGRVKQDRLTALLFQRVRIESGLDHNQRVAGIFMVQDMSVESRFIWRVVENLQELTSAKMEHELGVKSEVLFKSERCRVILSVISKAGA